MLPADGVSFGWSWRYSFSARTNHRPRLSRRQMPQAQHGSDDENRPADHRQDLYGRSASRRTLDDQGGGQTAHVDLGCRRPPMPATSLLPANLVLAINWRFPFQRRANVRLHGGLRAGSLRACGARGVGREEIIMVPRPSLVRQVSMSRRSPPVAQRVQGNCQPSQNDSGRGCPGVGSRSKVLRGGDRLEPRASVTPEQLETLKTRTIQSSRTLFEAGRRPFVGRRKAARPDRLESRQPPRSGPVSWNCGRKRWKKTLRRAASGRRFEWT